jgi:16S rRNA (cytidine1402-2'-O)-methyltransferase
MSTGTLRICGTPIGNLGDVSQRLRETLAHATVIACEDTRRTRALLTALGIPAPKLERLDANTEERGAARLVQRLVQGDDIALVTDAGMPSVSDPGTRLVQAAAAAGVVVEVIPGPSAVTAALAASGIDGDGFAFIGFLPRTSGGLNARLDTADSWGVPLIAFEAPSRLPRTLTALAARDPERRLVVCRELTKLHEQVVRGSTAEVAAQFREPPPGEVTIVLAAGTPRAAGGPSESDLDGALVELRNSGLGARRASEIAALLSGLPRRELYKRLTDAAPKGD